MLPDSVSMRRASALNRQVAAISFCETSMPRQSSFLPRTTEKKRLRWWRNWLVQTKRGSGPKALAEILPALLAKLGVKLIRLTESAEADPT